MSNPVGPEHRAFQYDPIGNRQQATGWDAGVSAPRAETYVTSELNQYDEITSDNGQQTTNNLTYDFDGNLTSIVSTSSTKLFKYNAENRLVAVEPLSPADGDTKVECSYDYLGRRVTKTVFVRATGTWNQTAEILFIYDGWSLIREITTEGVLPPENKYYVWGLDLDQTLQGAGGAGGLLASYDSALSASYQFLHDGNGNVGQLVNASGGSMAAHYEYDPYGNELLSSGPVALLNTFRFSTKYFDTEFEIYYYGYRYYSPEFGRWLSRDPLGEYGGLNLYVFANNNSVNLVDIYGLACTLEGVLTSAIKGAVVGFLKTYLVKKAITAGVKIAAAQIAPVAGQIAGIGMTAWEVISFGRTAYTVYTNSDKIKEKLQILYQDEELKKWINCLTEEDCNNLADQLGEVLGSLVANRKEIKQGLQRVKNFIKSFRKSVERKQLLNNGAITSNFSDTPKGGSKF